MIVRPHEGTLSRPKGDRLSLLWALRADTSPIMALYEDNGKKIAASLDAGTKGKPLFSVGDIDGESHRLWAINDEIIIRQISGALADQHYISRRPPQVRSAIITSAKRTSSKAAPGNHLYDFVMMTLLDSPTRGW
jgi:uncharacterized protein (DUF1015 family)